MKIEALGKQRTLEDWNKGHGNYIKMMRGEKVEIETRKKRDKETKPREQPERELRNIIIKELRKRRVVVKRIENSITGKNNVGIPDLLVFNRAKRQFSWLELKSLRGVLSPKQKEFREDCILCNTRHFVIRSLTEAIEAVL